MRFDSPSNYGPAHFGPSIFEADDAPSASRPGQIKFINDLRDQYEEAKAQLARLTGAEYVATRWGALPETADDASAAIDRGKAAVSTIRAQRDQAVSAGFYTDGDGVFWLVQISQNTGRPYTKVWNGESFSHDSGGIRELYAVGRRATLAEAEEFGVRFGVCGECGRTLTNEESIRRGIGPICAGKY